MNGIKDGKRKGGIIEMKRAIFLGIAIIMCFVLASCGKADPIALPEKDDVAEVGVTYDGETEYHKDTEWIDRVLSGIEVAEPTNKESVQDVPQVDDYIKIDFQLYNGKSTVFVYEDGGKYYVEQPYQGIYELDSAVYSLIKESNEE